MKLFGIIENEKNKNIGFELNYDKNITFLLRKTCQDILHFFDILYSMKSNVLQSINYIYCYDKLIKNIILNKKIDTENIIFNIHIPTLQVSEYLKVISNVIIITNKFNHGNILLNNENYNIDIINDEIIVLNSYFRSKLGKTNKIIIKIKLKSNQNYPNTFSFFKISNYFPLGTIIIQPKFIHMYFYSTLNVSISHIFNDYYKSKCVESCQSSSDCSSSDDDDDFSLKKKKESIERMKTLLDMINIYRENNVLIKNVKEFENNGHEECPICYCSDSNLYSIKICKNNHYICNKCLLKIFKNELSHKCPICRDSIYFEHDNDNNNDNDNYHKQIHLFKNKLNHINFFIY